MDAETALALFGGTQLAVKLLGPTAEYMGEGLHDFAQKRVENVRSIFDNAVKKLGDRIEEPGAVPPRVLAKVLNEGSYCDGPLWASYFGGVLASSRSGVPRDDRGAVLADLLATLTTYQLRSHYIFYQALRSLYVGKDLIILDQRAQHRMRSYIPMSTYEASLELTDPEDLNQIVQHVMNGLLRDSLIEEPAGVGDATTLDRGIMHGALDWEPDEQGIVFTPSGFGAELFLAAHGLGQRAPSDFLDSKLDVPTTEIPITFETIVPIDPELRRSYWRTLGIRLSTDESERCE